MPWKKGQSGNPQGRAIGIARKLVDAGIQPSESVYIAALDKRDPARELIKLADKTTDKEFKRSIWVFLFEQKYKAVRIVSKPVKAVEDSVQSDEETLKALEGKSENTQPSASNG